MSEQMTPSPELVEGQGSKELQDVARIRNTRIRQVTTAGLIVAVFTITRDVYFYLSTESWQFLAMAASLGLVVVCLMVARWALVRGRAQVAVYWMLFSTALAYGSSAALVKGLSIHMAVGGGLLIVFVGLVFLPRRWRMWLSLSLLFAGYVWLVNRVEPLPRYDVGSFGTIHVLVLGSLLVLGVAILWNLRKLRLGTIRNRLLVAFVLLVILPVAVTTFVSARLVASNSEDLIVSQLDSVATLKQEEIGTWVEGIKTDLLIASSGKDMEDYLQVFLGLDAAQVLLKSPYIKRDILDRFNHSLNQTGRLEELFLLNLNGQVMLSTDPMQEGKIYRNENFFRQGLGGLYVQPPKFYPSLAGTFIMVAQPVYDWRGAKIGTIAGRASLEKLDAIMAERAGLGTLGETYLVGPNQALLTSSRFEGYRPRETYVRTWGVNAALQERVGGAGVYTDYRGQRVIGVSRWVPELDVVLLAEQNQSEALGVARRALAINGGLAVGAAVLAVAAGVWVTRQIATPLAELVNMVTRVAAGELTLTVPVEREDEVGDLARSFNTMTRQLRELVAGLEQRVDERTQELAQRSSYLEAAAEVSRASASILDIDRLIRQIVELIRERFDLYYVGLFRLDASGDWAVLQAGTGQAGQVMLARGHRIRVGEGMIGWSIANALPRIASKAEADAVRLNTPELPLTRSEAALPLRSRGQVIGALSVQSEQPEAFNEDLLTVLQTMADQVAVAVQNARLFAESEESLEAARRAYGDISREGWRNLLQARTQLGFRRDERGILSLSDAEMSQVSSTAKKDARTLVQPVKVRDQVIGTINARKSLEASQWTAQEQRLLETVADQLGQALESARLYQETQRRARQEQLAREITEKVRAASDVETIAQVAAEELVKALGGARGFVKLRKEAPNGKDQGGEQR